MEQQGQHTRNYEGYDNSRKFVDFDAMLAVELDSIKERGLNDYIIFKKTENSHLKRKPRNLDPSVLYIKREVPLVVWVAHASTTAKQLQRYESKGWLIVAHSFSDQTKIEARVDVRLNDLIMHCQSAVRYAQSGPPIASKSNAQAQYEEALAKHEAQKAAATTNQAQEVKPRGRSKKQPENIAV